VRIHFGDPALRRLYETGVMDRIDAAVIDRVFQAIAVLEAAQSPDDFASLEAFALSPVEGTPETWEMPLGASERLLLTIDGTNEPTASLNGIREARPARRSR
jgi:plasmid maintenance system killer protein